MADLIRFVDAVAGINLITNSSFETDTSGWANNGNATVARSTAQAYVGTASMSMTAIAAGDMEATSATGTSGYPVTAGLPYVAQARFRAAATARSVYVRIGWSDSGGAFIGATAGTSVADTTSGWTHATVTATAPANAAYGRAFAFVVSPAAGEVHYVDAVMVTQTAAAIPYVDASGAATRLDLNDETAFWVKSFSAPPPRLRRSVASNAMRDGINVGSASYDGRTLTIELECRKSTQDLAAIEIQKLWRELDRQTNWLMYQPTGATKPVFFRTFRSDASQLEDVMAQAAMRTVTIEVLAEPFALGLMETLGPYTVTNNPTAGSNGCYFDVTGVIGDVPTPMILRNSVHRGATIMAVRQHGTPSAHTHFYQAESMTLVGADTTNPGGGPDAAMSGTGTNNFVRTTFATTATWATRLTRIPSVTTTDHIGGFVIYAAVRRSDATSVINVGLSAGAKVSLPLTTSRCLVRLGMAGNDGHEATLAGGRIGSLFQIAVNAERVSGAGTLDWDAIFVVPADEAVLQAELVSQGAAGTDAGHSDLFDGYGNSAIKGAITDPTTITLETDWPFALAGGFISLVPNQTNRVYWFTLVNRDTRAYDKTIVDTVTLWYWPHYVLVRPVST